MRKYVAAAFSIAVMSAPAAAVDLGVGAQVGGVGISADVNAGQDGASPGAGASLGSSGGADVGVSVGTGDGSVGATAGASGHLGGVGVGAGAGLGGGTGGKAGGSTTGVGGSTSAAGTATGTASVDAPGRSAATSRAKPGGVAAATAAVAPVESFRPTLALPSVLLPRRGGDRMSASAAIEAAPGTPVDIVRACRAAIEAAATPYGVVSVRAKGAGPLSHLGRGAVSAPIAVRIDYARQGGVETRQARIKCNLDAAGTVIGLT